MTANTAGSPPSGSPAADPSRRTQVLVAVIAAAAALLGAVLGFGASVASGAIAAWSGAKTQATQLSADRDERARLVRVDTYKSFADAISSYEKAYGEWRYPCHESRVPDRDACTKSSDQVSVKAEAVVSAFDLLYIYGSMEAVKIALTLQITVHLRGSPIKLDKNTEAPGCPPEYNHCKIDDAQYYKARADFMRVMCRDLAPDPRQDCDY